jgi:hypothetical protein
MKAILLIGFIFTISYGQHCDKSYSIKIWDANFSLAYTNLYIITNKSIEIKRIGGVIGEKDTTLLERKLRDNECEMILDLLDQLNMGKLKSRYSTPLIQDGNRKKVKIEIDKKVKTIEIDNFYQKDLGELFNTINNLIANENLKLKFRRHP